MSNNDVFREYKKTEVNTANQGKLIIMLYDGAIKFINRAIELIPQKKANNIEEIHNNIVKAQNIIYELTSSLNMDIGEISQRLFSIYMYINTKLTLANVNKDDKPLKEVKKYLIELRGAWEQATKNVSSSAKEVKKGGVNIAT